MSGTDARVAYAQQLPVHLGVDTSKRFQQLVTRGPDGRRLKAVRVDVLRAGSEAPEGYLQASSPAWPRAQIHVGLGFAGRNGYTFAYFLASRRYAFVSVLPSITKRLKDLNDNSPRKDDAKDAAQVYALPDQG